MEQSGRASNSNRELINKAVSRQREKEGILKSTKLHLLILMNVLRKSEDRCELTPHTCIPNSCF